MKRKRWSSKEKFRIVLEGITGQTEIASLCNKYQISQSQYYKWKGEFLKHGHSAFEHHSISKEEKRMETKIEELKKIIGELTLELKKSEVLL